MDEFYADLARVYREEIRDLAAAGCRYLQIDEVNFAYLCDPELRQQVANIGEDPATLPKTYAKLLNDAIAGQPADMTVCMHLCRGNFAGAWVAEGGYEPVAELLFNEIDVDGYFLEYDSPRAGGFEPLRFLPKGKIAVLGLVTTKARQMETKDELKRRIDEASRYAPLEQLGVIAAMRLLHRHRRQRHDSRRRDRQARARGRDRARGVGRGVIAAPNVSQQRGTGVVRQTLFRTRSRPKRSGVRRPASLEKPIPKRRRGDNNLSRSDTGTGSQNTSSCIPTSRRRRPP